MAAPQAWEWGPDPPWHAWKFYCPAFTLWPPVLQEFHFQVLSVLACLMLWKKNGHTEQQDCSKKMKTFINLSAKRLELSTGQNCLVDTLCAVRTQQLLPGCWQVQGQCGGSPLGGRVTRYGPSSLMESWR